MTAVCWSASTRPPCERSRRRPAGSVRKAARPSLAAALAAGGWAATTVSATMIAAHAAGIRVFATGGIGGVHRGALGGGRTAGVDADVRHLVRPRGVGRTPIAVVCAGPKAILDVPATLEYLETRGVPVVAVGQAELPGLLRPFVGHRARRSSRRRTLRPLRRVVRAHLELGLGGAILVCVPVPAEEALPEDVAREAVETAIADADDGRDRRARR